MANKIHKYKQGKETEALLLPNMSNLSSSIPSQEQEVIRNKIRALGYRDEKRIGFFMVTSGVNQTEHNELRTIL